MTQNNWHTLSVDEVFVRVNSKRHGLTDSDVKLRLDIFGRNELQTRAKTPLVVIFLRQFVNPLVFVLVVAALIKIFVQSFFDAAVIFAVLLFMAVIGFIQELKAEKAMHALMLLAAPKAKVRRNGSVQQILAKNVVPGDIILLETGDKVSADARLIEITNLKVNESSLTGESMPVEKQTEPLSADALIAERKNIAYMGTAVTSGRATAVVIQTGMQTELGKIATAIQTIKPEQTPLQKSITSLSHYLIVTIAVACAFIAVIAFNQGLPWLEVFMLIVAIVVAAIPEGLPAVVTVVLAVGVQIMARRNAIIRKLVAVETLGSATVICSDKTGTLTLNQMTVRKIYTEDNWIDVTGQGYQPKGQLLQNGTAFAVSENTNAELLLHIGALCNNSLLTFTEDKDHYDIIGDPTEGAFIVAAAKVGFSKEKLEESFPRLDEIPFQSEYQYMATLHRRRDRRVAYLKGSPEKILSWSSQILKNDQPVKLEDADIKRIKDAQEKMANDALRVIALAYLEYPVEFGRLNQSNLKNKLIFVGLAGMIDPARDDAKKAIQLCQQAHINVAMITGDNKITALAIARQLGLPAQNAIVGQELQQITDEQLKDRIEDTHVFARIEPLHKLRIVNAFKSRGHIVAMTGDGVNDAPALERADIGIAMGLTGTDVAKEASDMILADDNFASIVTAVEESRAIFNRLRNVIFFLLTTCFGELMTLMLAIAFIGKAPLLPIQILWINLVTGGLIAIPLGLEPKTGDELLQPPRHPKVGLIFPGMALRVGFVAAMLSISAFLVFKKTLQLVSIEEARTVVFCSVVSFEWFIAFNARSDHYTIFKLGVLKNRNLIITGLIAVALQFGVVYLPIAHPVFNTVPLGLYEWLIVLLPGLFIFTVETIRKLVFPNLFSLGKWQPVFKRNSDPIVLD